jgi:putrescine transport system permease protein
MTGGRRSPRDIGAALALPPLVWLCLFLGCAMLIVFGVSLTEPRVGIPPFAPLVAADDAGGIAFNVDLERYLRIFTDSYYVESLLSSLRIAAIATFACLLLGYPLAYAISRAGPRAQIMLVLLVTVPFWTSFLIRIYAWSALLNTNGLVNQALIGLGLITQPIQLLHTEGAVIMGIVYGYLPFLVLPIYTVLHRLDPSLVEAARDLGAGPWRAFLRVTVPMSLPGIVTGCLLVAVPAIGEFVVPELLGGSSVLMFGRVLWDETFHNRDWPMAAAMTIMLLLLVLIATRPLQRLAYQRGVAE